MIVTRNEQKEAMLLDELVASFSRPLPAVTLPEEEQVRGDEIHISDLLKVRQAYWSRTLPQQLRRDEALNFTTGRAHEEILHRRMNLVWSLGARRHKMGLQYRPDIDWMGRPTEFKTRIRNLARPGEEAITYDNYLEQLQAYCALDENPQGHLIVLSLAEGMDINNNRVPTHRELAVYDVDFSPFDLQSMRDHLTAQRDAFIAAREGRLDPRELRLCPEWMCGKQKKVVDQKARCQYPGCDTVHKMDRPGGHTMIPEVAHFEYEPKCKWYVFCRPALVDPTRQAR